MAKTLSFNDIYSRLSKLVPDRFGPEVPDRTISLWTGPFVVIPNGDDNARFVGYGLYAIPDANGSPRVQINPHRTDYPHFYQPASIQAGGRASIISITSANSENNDIVIRPLIKDDAKFFAGRDMEVEELAAYLDETDV